jgi:ferrous iron transport protein B
VDISCSEAASPEADARASETIPHTISRQPEFRTVCLAGVPNAGKTALMNALTGGSFHTANYPGVTVTLSRGKSRPEFGSQFDLIDLPGVMSPQSPSPEEELACCVLEDRHSSIKPDAIIVVVDATQLERHLKFASFVAKLGKPLVVALTMMDLLARSGQSISRASLESAIGLPVVPVDGRTGWGVEELTGVLRRAASSPGSQHDNALATLPGDPIAGYRSLHDLLESSGSIRRAKGMLLVEDSFTSRIDRFVLNRYLGFPIFFAVLALLFSSIFWAARPFMDLVDWSFKETGTLVLKVLPEGVLSRFVAEGLLGGVGAVAVFFPQIVILFFLMTLLEDSGYLSRGAALVDRPLSYLGLHGRSFVPMLSGYACAIPAVLAARTIPSRRERLLTIWIIPLMSCSARLPVYALLLAALLPSAAAAAGLALAVIYISSLLIAALTAGLISRFVLRKRSASMLAMEMPLYRKPLWKPTLRITWTRSSSYLRKAGTPIIVISACLWLLANFGPGSRGSSTNEVKSATLVTSSDLDHSFAARVGQSLEPALHPMGVDWRVGVGLISAFAAREVFVSTMAVVFHVSDDEATRQAGLLESMRAATFPGSPQRVFTTSSIIGLIVFFFFSLQCLSTVSVVKTETGSWRFAGLHLLFYTGLGYLLSCGVVQGLRLFGVN